MRTAHKIGLLVIVIVVLLLALLLPRSGHAGQSMAFGNVVVRYSAISTDQLFAEIGPVDLEEELEDGPVGGPRGIEGDLTTSA